MYDNLFTLCTGKRVREDVRHVCVGKPGKKRQFSFVIVSEWKLLLLLHLAKDGILCYIINVKYLILRWSIDCNGGSAADCRNRRILKLYARVVVPQPCFYVLYIYIYIYIHLESISYILYFDISVVEKIENILSDWMSDPAKIKLTSLSGQVPF